MTRRRERGPTSIDESTERGVHVSTGYKARDEVMSWLTE